MIYRKIIAVYCHKKDALRVKTAEYLNVKKQVEHEVTTGLLKELNPCINQPPWVQSESATLQ
jgi:hypothetical protein